MRLHFIRMPSYKNYLYTDHWNKLRKEAFEFYGRKCEISGLKTNLHVHHLSYKRFYDVDIVDLMILNEYVHNIIHEWIKKENLYKPSDSSKYKRMVIKLRWETFAKNNYRTPKKNKNVKMFLKLLRKSNLQKNEELSKIKRQVFTPKVYGRKTMSYQEYFDRKNNRHKYIKEFISDLKQKPLD